MIIYRFMPLLSYAFSNRTERWLRVPYRSASARMRENRML